MGMRCVRGLLVAGLGLAGAGGCASPTVTLATEKPIEIKIDLRHEVRVRLDREVSEMIRSQAESPAVTTRSASPDDDALARAAKAGGVLGEQADGYLGLRLTAPGADDRALAVRLNERRRDEYRALAVQSDVPLAQVEKAAGANRIAKASPGEWVRAPDGTWIEKDETTVVVVRDRPGTGGRSE